MTRTIKRYAFSAVNAVVALPTTRNTVVVSGAPRSGTTWLAEVLRDLPGGYKLISEPLRLNTNPTARRAGFSWRTCIHPSENRPEAEKYLRNVLRGKVELGPAWHFRSESSIQKFFEHITHRSLIVKFCRAGRMLHWLDRVFDVRGPLVIIRHPCAVISSMLSMGENWTTDHNPERPYSDHFPEFVPTRVRDQFARLFDNRSLWVEHLAIRWCLDYYFAFFEHASEGHPWLLTTYERLLVNQERELNRIVNGLGGKMTGKMRQRLDVPAQYASQSLHTTSRNDQLMKWRRSLSTKQIDAILKIVDAFDMNFYTEALHPDYEQLNAFQKEEYRWSASQKVQHSHTTP